jgi:hypothetical protein
LTSKALTRKTFTWKLSESATGIMAGQLMAPRSDVTLGTRPLLVLALTLIAVALYAYIGDVRLHTFLLLY